MADASGLIGRVFEGRYQLEAEIGHGSMATVFRATHLTMQQTVAVKVLTELSPGDDSQVGRFTTEVRACSRLKHPNTIRVFDFGRSEEGFLYLAMEFLEGEPLGRLLAREGPLPTARAAGIARQAAKSLGEAHRVGLVHRDLKPDNLFLTEVFGERDFVKVLDFGVAKVLENPSGDEPMTQAGVVLGTPLYLSPEQALGRDLDGRTDLYALGAMLYEMLTGRPPFRAPSPIAVVMKHIHDAVPPFSVANPAVEVPPALETLVLKMLAKDREDRPASAEAFLEALDAALDGAPPPARKEGMAPTKPGTPAPVAPPPAVPSAAPVPVAPPRSGPSPRPDPDGNAGDRTMVLAEDQASLRPPRRPPAPPGIETRVTHDWGTSSPVAPPQAVRRHVADDEGIVFSGDDDTGGVTLILDRTDAGQLLGEARTALDLSGSPPLAVPARPAGGPPTGPAAKPASPGSSWVLVAGVVLTLGLAGGAAWALLGNREVLSPEATPPAAVTEPAPAAATPSAAPAPASAPVASPADAAVPASPAKAPLPVAVSVTVVTTPTAEVVSGGKVLGRTPHSLRLSDGDPAVRLQLRAPGFRPLDVTLLPRDVIESGRTNYAYDLAPEPASGHRAGIETPRSTGSPATMPGDRKARMTATPSPRPASAPKPAKKPVLNWDE